MHDESRIQVDLVDCEDGVKFNIVRYNGNNPMQLDDFTAEAFKEYGDIFTEGLSMNNAANEQAITAAVTNVSDLLKMVLDNYDSECSSFKCILASSLSCAEGVRFVSKEQKITAAIFTENYVILAQKICSAMRKTKAGNANGSNIYRQVHCIVNRGGATAKFQPYAYATFTILLQVCMFIYVFMHSVLNMPKHSETWANMPLAGIVLLYQVLLLLPEIKDTLIVSASGFWDSGKYSVLRMFDVVSNIIMPIVLLPIGVMLVLTAENMLEAVLSSTAVLFIPTLDNDIINLMGESDGDTVKKYIAQETIHEIADHFFQFQIALEESDGFGDLESCLYGSTTLDAAPRGAGNMKDTQRRLTQSVTTLAMSGREIEEPVLLDLAITGEDVLLRCVVFDAFSTTRSLLHLHKTSFPHSSSSSATTPLKSTRTREIFAEIPRQSYQEVFFSESKIISTSSLFTKMEYIIEDQPPYALVYLKLWRLGGESDSHTVEYRTKRHREVLPVRRLEPGCFIITNIIITDCIDTLRLCWSPTAAELLRAINYYTIFSCDDAAERAMRGDKTTTKFHKGSKGKRRRTSDVLSHCAHSQSVYH